MRSERPAHKPVVFSETLQLNLPDGRSVEAVPSIYQRHEKQWAAFAETLGTEPLEHEFDLTFSRDLFDLRGSD